MSGGGSRAACWQTGDWGLWREEPGRGSKDEPRFTAVPTSTSQLTVLFKVHILVHWALSIYINKLKLKHPSSSGGHLEIYFF